MLFKRFFVVSGKGVSGISKLNAFDRALFDAGISQCNLVPVSSILPENAKQIKPAAIKPGTITFTVLSRKDGGVGEKIGAGIGWGFCTDSRGKETHGIVVEDGGFKSKKLIREDIKLKLQDMAEVRGMKLTKYDMKIEYLDIIPEGFYGSVIAALIYVP